MSDYAIRITRASCDLSGVYDRFAGVSTMLVVYEHPDEGNVHVHMLMMGCKVGTDTLKNYVRKEVGTVLAKDWSFKAKANKDFIAYMSKGKYDPVYMYGICADEVAVYKAQGYDKKNIRLEDGRFVKPVKEVVKKTKRELVELMVSSIDLNGTTRDVMSGIKKVLIKNNQVLGNYKVIEFYDAVMMYGNEDKWLDRIVYMSDRRFDR